MRNERLSLAFVGDISLGFLKRRRWEEVVTIPDWNCLKAAIGTHVLLIGNLECCFVDERCSERARMEGMAVPASKASLLDKAGFSVLSLANNHILDCGEAAVAVTRERLADLGVKTFGAGRNVEEAEAIVVARSGNHRIAFLGACDFSPYYATEQRAGIAAIESSKLECRVQKAVGVADIVVVVLHADLEFSDVPARWRQKLSRRLVDAGANLVIQHHPHVLQGIEHYKGGLIAYSLGNFIFPLVGNAYQERHAGVFDSMVLVVDILFDEGKSDITYRLEPAVIAEDHFPRCPAPKERQAAIQEFSRLTRLIEKPILHRRLWFRRCRKEVRSRLWNAYYALRRYEIRAAWAQLWRLISRAENRRWLIGLVTFGYV